ncbi:hypothetical protein [Mucilaginibacter sp. FT3.2]|uniref:hypothetical protein n=1 Tax=Mucilaginibacter sp. FT3.2 TaxID=2723090 RepID=UPI00161447B2|nr:hypothetical protein [Mucilaginibacter sp. FT3.2]MBB6232545.1 hypothetical protein [Mucilaginibacter sp. FT3.2]
MNWNPIVIVICILLAVFAVWKEVVRLNKSRLLPRIVASIIAVAALACIVIPLSYQIDVNKQDKNEALLLTDGFSKDSLIQYKTEKLFTLDGKIKKDIPKAIQIFDLGDLRSDSTITQVRILGNGLNKTELQQFGGLPLAFHPIPVKQGITAISWNKQLKTGEDLNIQGIYQNTLAKKIKLVLNGLSTGLDSTIIEAGKTAPFNLNTVPKNSGRNIYSLLVLAGGDTLEKESIPVQIEHAKPLKVLMLTSSPDFESRFLKNWLSENGYAVVVRSAISKDKFNKEFINIEQFPLDHLSAAVFNKFDVLIGDLSVLKTLNSAEAAALQQDVNQKGLGVIVRADSALKSDYWMQRNFSSDRLAVKDPAPVSLILQGKMALSAKLNAGIVYINNQNNIQSLVSDKQGHILAASTLAGAGKLVFTPLNSTFSWVLGGNKTDYAGLWSLLISKVTRKLPTSENWTVKSAIPTLSNPVELLLESATIPSDIQIEGGTIGPKQNAFIPFEWLVKYWPTSAGWQSVKQANGMLKWFYVYNNADWRSIRALKKQADTKAYVIQHAINSNVTKQIQEKATITVRKIYFYVLLLMACAFLWLEARFR